MPIQTKLAREAGRLWLAQQHEIPERIIAAAEAAGFVHYEPGSVAFCGREGDRIMSAWRHSLTNQDIRRVVHSDLAYSPVMPGDPNRVVLCGSGVAALRALAEAAREGRPLPTVIALDPDHPIVSLGGISDELRSRIANSIQDPTWYGLIVTETMLHLVAKIRGGGGPGGTQPPAYDAEAEQTYRNPSPTEKP